MSKVTSFFFLMMLLIGHVEAAVKKQKISVMVGLGLNQAAQKSSFIMSKLLRNGNKTIVSMFEKHFKGQNFELEFSYYPDRYTIWHTINNPEYVAVFWIGHGSEGKTSKLYDGDNFEITDVFSSVSPNLKYLALITCYSDKATKALKTHLTMTKSKLKLVSFSGQIPLEDGIKSALQKSSPVLNDPQVKNGYRCVSKKEQGIHVKIQRTCKGDNTRKVGYYPAVSIKTIHNNKTLAALPPCMNRDEIQDVTFILPLGNSDFDSENNLKDTGKLDLQILAGKRMVATIQEYAGINLGDFKVTHDGEGKWLGIKDPKSSGTAKVEEENLMFVFNDISTYHLHVRDTHFCEDMPGR